MKQTESVFVKNDTFMPRL